MLIFIQTWHSWMSHFEYQIICWFSKIVYDIDIKRPISRKICINYIKKKQCRKPFYELMS